MAAGFERQGDYRTVWVGVDGSRAVGMILLDRPTVSNSLNRDMMQVLSHQLRDLRHACDVLELECRRKCKTAPGAP
jgi:enoyl-CoA hydratase/carnithine racemase